MSEDYDVCDLLSEPIGEFQESPEVTPHRGKTPRHPLFKYHWNKIIGSTAEKEWGKLKKKVKNNPLLGERCQYQDVNLHGTRKEWHTCQGGLVLRYFFITVTRTNKVWFLYCFKKETNHQDLDKNELNRLEEMVEGILKGDK